MNKKKTFFIIGIYLLCLVAVICLFLFYLNYQNQKDKSYALMAKTEIKEDTIITSNNINVFFEQKEVPNYVVDQVQSYGNVLIKDGGSIVNKEAAVDIKPGTFILESMFTVISEDFQQDGFKKPVLLQMPVTSKSAPVNGFQLEQKITIFGKMSLSSIVSGEGEGESQYENAASQNWLGIITNKAVVKKISYDENQNISGVSIVVEETAVSSLIIASANAELYYFDGVLTDIPSQVESDILKGIYDSTGLGDNRNFAMLMENKDSEGNITSLLPIDYINPGLDYEELPIFKVLKTDISTSNSINFTWVGSAVNAFITNYKFDGQYGNNHGSYSYISSDISKKISYNQNNETHSFQLDFTDEGYYEIEFKNIQKEVVAKYRFIIEGSDYEWQSNGSLNLEISEESSDKFQISGFDNSFYLTKTYFQNIPQLKEYKEVIKLNQELGTLIDNNFVYDAEEGIGTLLNKEIQNMNIIVSTQNGTSTNSSSMNLFWGINKNKIDYEVDDNIISYFETTNAGININGLLYNGINLIQNQGDFLKNNFKYNELAQLIAQVNQYVEIVGGTDDTSMVLKSLLKYSLFSYNGLTQSELLKIGQVLYGEEYSLFDVPTSQNGSIEVSINLGNDEIYKIPVNLFIVDSE